MSRFDCTFECSWKYAVLPGAFGNNSLNPFIIFFRRGGVGKHSVLWGAGEWKVRKYACSVRTRHFEGATLDL